MKSNIHCNFIQSEPILKKLIARFGFLVLATILALPLSIPDVSASADFCWRDSYGRGVGKVPKKCSSDQQKLGALCYTKCNAGMKRKGFDCHSKCPEGMRDDGLFCRATEYGRGAGYVAWDKKKCQKKHGTCVKSGAMWYPKCKAGYKSFGANICRPNKPNCKKLGLKTPGFDLSCPKKVAVILPVTGQCSSGQQKHGGLCYKKCKSGYQGVGPVCWDKEPKNWVECGMGAAKNNVACANVVFDQVASTGKMAFKIATFGAAHGAEADKAKEVTELKKDFQALKKAWKVISGEYKTAMAIDSMTADKVTWEDIVRAAAEIASIVDPSGVSGVVGAYTYAKCSEQ